MNSVHSFVYVITENQNVSTLLGFSFPKYWPVNLIWISTMEFMHNKLKSLSSL